MSVTAFIEQLNSVGPHRMIDLFKAGTVGGYYVLLGPGDKPAARQNREQWHGVGGVSTASLPQWAWYVCSTDQNKDVAEIEELDHQFDPVGWVLNIEKWLEGVKLDTLIPRVAVLGKPIVASLGGSQTASHIWLDYRTMDKYKVQCNWQAYFDSKEGAAPAVVVQELYQSTFVIPGWEYRARYGNKFGWGKVTRVEAGQKAIFDSYQVPTKDDAWFSVSEREWGNTVMSRALFRNGTVAGLLFGRAPYNKIAVTLDVTRTAQARDPKEWPPIAASARVPGATRRPISIYLLDNCTDEVVRAIAAGAG